MRVYSFSSDTKFCKRVIAEYGKNVRQEFTCLNDYVQFVRNDLHRSAWFSHDAKRHADNIRGDLFKMLNTRKAFYNVDGNTSVMVRRISAVSQLPHAAFLSSLHDYKSISSKMPLWKKQYQDYPDFQERLVAISKLEKDTSKTIAAYQKLIKLLPDEQKILMQLRQFQNEKGINKKQHQLTENEVFNKPLESARISFTPGMFSRKYKGSSSPEWLQDATAYRSLRRRLPDGYKLMDAEIEFQVTRTGYMLLGFVNYKQRNPKAVTHEVLTQYGWYTIDSSSRTYNMQPIASSHTVYRLYIKHVKKGERHFYAANRVNYPFVVLPSEKTLNMMRSYSRNNVTPYERRIIENRKKRSTNLAAGFPIGTVGLTLIEPDKKKMKHYAGSLTRELMRQSFLISARDEIGFATRDDSLQELTNSGLKIAGENPVYHMISYIESEKAVDTLRTVLYQHRESGLVVPVQLTHEFAGHLSEPGTTDIKNMYSTPLWKLIIFAEGLSRTKFREALSKNSSQPLKKTKNQKIIVKPFHNDGVVPEEIEKQLDEWNWLSLYSAIRRLHVEIQQEGESPQLLGALIRAYANLGSLTEYFSSPSSKVFKARALLYAQRLRVKTKTSPFAQYHWAYAFALVGQDNSAQHTLRLVKKNPAADDAPDIWKKIPVWGETLSYFCDYNLVTLQSSEVVFGSGGKVPVVR